MIIDKLNKILNDIIYVQYNRINGDKTIKEVEINNLKDWEEIILTALDVRYYCLIPIPNETINWKCLLFNREYDVTMSFIFTID